MPIVPKKTLEALSEPMFYVLMALHQQNLCGADIVTWVNKKTGGRVALGPGTLYTILPKLTDEGILQEVGTEGRKRTYTMTEKGSMLYEAECQRLQQVVRDIDREGDEHRLPFKKEA